jgi:2-polyprenyl-3-methyl-5-hydroxy-6-metoxy-1,4-benzoquinol methylase
MNRNSSPGKPVLVVPCAEPGKGGGHLIRSAALVGNLRRLGREAFLYLEKDPPLAETLLGGLSDGEGRSWLIPGRREASGFSWGLIILDRFRTPPEEYRFWSALGPLLGIDEGGSLRDDFDFLLDLLPGPPSPPNILDPSLLPLPARRRSLVPYPHNAPAASLRFQVLVSFGAEDRSRLGPLVAGALGRRGKDLDITLLDPLNGKFIPDLREHLAEYDLLITHFGITAFEALHAGVAVLLVSPGDYHEKLARGAGFFSAGIGPRGSSRLSRLLVSPDGALRAGFVEKLRERCAGLAKRYGLDKIPPSSLAALVDTFSPSGNFRRNRPCPLCGTTAGDPAETPSRDKYKRLPVSTRRVLARFPDRSYWRCPRCGIVYMCRTNEPPIEYARDYFFESYKKQYGKTYIEDFPNLIAAAERRLKLISSLLPKGEGIRPRLLDVGCAYGPFLKAAVREGFDPLGIEAAEEATLYVREELKIPVIQGFFPLEPSVLQGGSFSVLSFWYVIEHFGEPGSVLKEAGRLLKPGGVLAFATPSFQGISGRRSLKAFLENSPADHWTVWGPGICGALLKKTGFSLKKIVITGHHPERFPLAGPLFRKKKGAFYAFFLLASRLFRLGDTFEIYAVKD